MGLSDLTWQNLVAFQVWECKICHEVPDEPIENHLRNKHGLHSVIFVNDAVYSDEFVYPNIIKKVVK